MNVLVIGSVSSSAVALEALVQSGVSIVGVLGLDESRAEAVSDYARLRPIAENAGIAFQPFLRLREPAVAEFIRARHVDLLWVIGLSQLVPNELRALAQHGGVGFHPTMLPRGRGRAPVAWTIILGERAAATLFMLADRADSGDIIAQRHVPVLPTDYSHDLIARTNEVLFGLVTDLAPNLRSGKLVCTPQRDNLATYYGKRTPDDGRILWNRTTEHIHRLVRAAGRPYPGAFSFLGDRRLTVWRAEPATAAASERTTNGPGTIVDRDAHGLLIRTLDGHLRITELDGIDTGDARVGQHLTPLPGR